jgi:hypothetical protein
VRPAPLELTVTGERTPGRTATVTATVGNESVRDAALAIDGSVLGRTNRSGAIGVTLPYRRNVTLRAVRGGLTANRTVDLPDELDVSTRGFVLPGLSVVTTARLNGTAVPEATVRGGGRTVGTTDSAGRLEVSLPIRNTYRVTVERGELQGTATVTGILVLPGAIGIGLLLVVGATMSSRYLDVGPAPRSLIGRLRRVARTLFGRLVASLVGVAATVARGLDRLAAYGQRLLVDTVGTLRATPGYVVAHLRRAATAIERRARDALGSVRARGRELGRRLRRLGSALRDLRPRDVVRVLAAVLVAPFRRGDGAAGGDRRTGAGTAGDSGAGAGTTRRVDVRYAWTELTETVSVSDPRTATAVQYRDRAFEDGLPADAVTVLAELYRKVEYGRHEVTDDDERRAWQALERVRDARGGESDG